MLIAEHNRNRIVEREIDGKEIWSETINQPVNVGRLPNGVTWAIGRNQIIEWERGDKSNKKHVFDFIRNEYDIVAGARMKNGEYVLLTQNQQLLKVDRKGAIVKSHGVGGNGVNYYATVDITPTGKALCTLMNSITEFDIESGKAGWTANFQYATSAVRLRNGNTLVGQPEQRARSSSWTRTASRRSSSTRGRTRPTGRSGRSSGNGELASVGACGPTCVSRTRRADAPTLACHAIGLPSFARFSRTNLRWWCK